MCQLRASRYERDDIFGLKKILQIDLNVKYFELIERCIATLDMNKLIFWKNCRSFFFEVSWILVLVMTFKKLLIWKMPWFLYLHLSRHKTTVIGRFCGHYLFLVMQKLGQQNWTLEYASIVWQKDIYLDRKYNQWWKPSMVR